MAVVVRLLVGRANAKNRTLNGIDWTPPEGPSFDVSERPRTDSGTQQQRSVLDWYLEVG